MNSLPVYTTYHKRTARLGHRSAMCGMLAKPSSWGALSGSLVEHTLSWPCRVDTAEQEAKNHTIDIAPAVTLVADRGFLRSIASHCDCWLVRPCYGRDVARGILGLVSAVTGPVQW